MVTGCSDLKNNIPTASEKVSVHGDKFSDMSDTVAFHGNVLAKSNYDFKQCQVCHGENFAGGSSKKSCYSCHGAGDIHKVGFNISTFSDSLFFHGKMWAEKANYSLNSCRNCHGSKLDGNGSENKNCRKCHGVSKLHADGSTINDVTSSDFHGKLVAGNDWDFGSCTSCHGEDYSGGKVGVTCKSCHTQPAGPEACNTCHGDFGDPTSTAPPRALDGSTAISSRGVGAHAAHLTNTQWSVAVKCEECHKVPTAFTDEGHIDFNDPIGRADLIFGSLSITTTASTTPSPAYNYDDLSCASTYCHGTMKGGVSANAPKWTDGPVKCGSCHGDGADNPAPLDASHNVFPLAIRMKCESCHSSSTVKTTLTGTTYTYTFTNKSKHLNGVVDR